MSYFHSSLMSLFFPNIGFLKVNSKNSVEKLIFGVFVNGKTQFFSFYWIRIFFQKCITCWDFSCKCRRMVYKNSYISYISFSVLSIFGVALFYKCVDELNIQAEKNKGRKNLYFLWFRRISTPDTWNLEKVESNEMKQCGWISKWHSSGIFNMFYT